MFETQFYPPRLILFVSKKLKWQHFPPTCFSLCVVQILINHWPSLQLAPVVASWLLGREQYAKSSPPALIISQFQLYSWGWMVRTSGLPVSMVLNKMRAKSNSCRNFKTSELYAVALGCWLGTSIWSINHQTRITWTWTEHWWADSGIFLITAALKKFLWMVANLHGQMKDPLQPLYGLTGFFAAPSGKKCLRTLSCRVPPREFLITAPSFSALKLKLIRRGGSTLNVSGPNCRVLWRRSAKTGMPRFPPPARLSVSSWSCRGSVRGCKDGASVRWAISDCNLKWPRKFCTALRSLEMSENSHLERNGLERNWNNTPLGWHPYSALLPGSNLAFCTWKKVMQILHSSISKPVIARKKNLSQNFKLGIRLSLPGMKNSKQPWTSMTTWLVQHNRESTLWIFTTWASSNIIWMTLIYLFLWRKFGQLSEIYFLIRHPGQMGSQVVFIRIAGASSRRIWWQSLLWCNEGMSPNLNSSTQPLSPSYLKKWMPC